MGSCNYSHKLNGRAGDGVLGISGEGAGGEGERVGEGAKRGEGLPRRKEE